MLSYIQMQVITGRFAQTKAAWNTLIWFAVSGLSRIDKILRMVTNTEPLWIRSGSDAYLIPLFASSLLHLHCISLSFGILTLGVNAGVDPILFALSWSAQPCGSNYYGAAPGHLPLVTIMQDCSWSTSAGVYLNYVTVSWWKSLFGKIRKPSLGPEVRI